MAEITLAVAALAGLGSFIAPCILPMIPAFLAYISGTTVTELGQKTTFCGIIGTSKNPQMKLKLFEEKDVSIVLDSINLLPKILNRV